MLSFLKTTKGLIVGIGAVLIVLIISGMGWTRYKFNDTSLCLACHELFVPVEEYMPTEVYSEDIEDYKPTEGYGKGFFSIGVGCAECHMYPYEEYKESAHYDNDRDVKPGCIGCHDPHGALQFFRWKFLYINNGTYGRTPFHAVSNSIRDLPEWEELRVKLAKRVREQMLEERSYRCEKCHNREAVWFTEIDRHKMMLEKNLTCIECHYNLVHADVPWPEMEEAAEEEE